MKKDTGKDTDPVKRNKATLKYIRSFTDEWLFAHVGSVCEYCRERYLAGWEPDPCIGKYLDGVSHACCGHGDPYLAYVTIGGEIDQNLEEVNYKELAGVRAWLYFLEQGCGPLTLNLSWEESKHRKKKAKQEKQAKHEHTEDSRCVERDSTKRPGTGKGDDFAARCNFRH